MDGGNPRLSDDSVVLVTVNRNLFPPDWAPDNYQQTIRDNFFPGISILRVTATDRDQQVSTPVVSLYVNYKTNSHIGSGV